MDHPGALTNTYLQFAYKCLKTEIMSRVFVMNCKKYTQTHRCTGLHCTTQSSQPVDARLTTHARIKDCEDAYSTPIVVERWVPLMKTFTDLI